MAKTKTGYIETLGVVELIVVTCSSGNTSKAVVVRGRKSAKYVVLPTPTWNTTVWISAQTSNGFTLNFSDPGATKKIQVAVIGDTDIVAY